jgi:hypothetical protein
MANYINNNTLLSGLVKYRDELSMQEILIESVYSAKTLERVKVEFGVKGTQTINLMTSQPVWTVAACGLQAGTGSVTLLQQDITVSDLSQTEDLCLVGDNTLSKYYTGALMPKGMNQEELTPKIFATAFIADKMQKTKDTVEKLVWIGNTDYAPGASGSFSSLQYANLADGFLYQLKYGGASASVINGNGTYGGASMSNTNAVDIVNYMITQIPQEILDKDLTLFVSVANYQKIVNNLITLNNYHYTAIDATGVNKEISFPFLSNLNIVATNGLVNRNDMVISYAENFYVGVDGEHDYEQFKIWYSDDLNAVRYRLQMRLGTAIAYPQYVVWFKG